MTAKSDLLRFQDVRDAYRLIGECRDLGGDADLWHRRMLEGLCRLVGAPAEVEPTLAIDVGLDAGAHQQLLRFFHGELGRLIGRSLVDASAPRSDKLPPRLRQTLACLVEGDSEKQLAGAARAEPGDDPSVRDFTLSPLRRQQPPQLLALAIKRMARAGWGQIFTDGSRSPRG